MRAFRLSAVTLVLTTVLASGQFATNWVAFNDHNTSGQPAPTTGPNVTLYNLGGLTAGGGPIGPLTNQLTGQQLAAELVVSWTGGDGPDSFGASTDADPGSPADLLFRDIVDIGGAGVGTDEGILGLRSTETNVISITFSNLDTSQRYLFRGTSARGNSYNDRWALYTIRAASFVDAHVDASANKNLFTGETFPASGLTSGQVALNSGENRVGSLVGWNDIVPLEDGTFTIVEEQYVGTAPFGNPAAGPYGYGLNAIMLAEIFTGPPSSPTIVTQPVGVTNSEGQVAILRVVATGTPPLSFQWFQGTPDSGVPIEGATRATFAVTNIAASGQSWSVPSDSGTYYVTVNGALAPPVTSTPVSVRVDADTTPPAFLHATCTTNLNEVVITLSEPITATGELTDNFNWPLQDMDSGEALIALDVTYVEGSASILVRYTTPRDPSHAYQISYIGAALTDRSAAGNAMPGPASIPINCIETEVVPLNATWHYQDDGTDPGPNWFAADFNDAGWQVGSGPFDAKRDGAGAAGPNCRDAGLYALGAIGTCLRLESPVTGTNLITAYFRTRFSFGGNPSTTILQLNGKYDDGAQVYLNGVELQRVGLPAAPAAIGHDTMAPRSVGDADGQDTAQFLFPAALRNGDNQLAVALHQNSLTSSDLTMGLRIVALTQTAVSLPGPTLTITREGANVRIRWTPAGGTLQFSDTFPSVPAWANQMTGQIVPGEYLIPASQAHRFYRVSIP